MLRIGMPPLENLGYLELPIGTYCYLGLLMMGTWMRSIPRH